MDLTQNTTDIRSCVYWRMSALPGDLKWGPTSFHTSQNHGFRGWEAVELYAGGCIA
jgi:hypothetical protein